MSKLIRLFLSLVVTVSSTAQDAKEKPLWDVVLTVIVNFPYKAVGQPIFGISEPPETDLVIHVGDPDRDVWEITIRPLRSDVPRPTHLVLSMTAYGFKPLSINTGVLNFTEGHAKPWLTIEPEVDKAPIVEQMVPLERKGTSRVTYEVSIFNPSEKEVNISSVHLVSTQSTGVHCRKEDARPVFSFEYPVAGNVMRGTLENTSSGDGFTYLTKTTLIEGCGKRLLKISSPFNYAIPAATRVFLRLQLPDPPSDDLVRKVPIHQGLDGSKTAPWVENQEGMWA